MRRGHHDASAAMVVIIIIKPQRKDKNRSLSIGANREEMIYHLVRQV